MIRHVIGSNAMLPYLTHKPLSTTILYTWNEYNIVRQPEFFLIRMVLGTLKTGVNI